MTASLRFSKIFQFLNKKFNLLYLMWRKLLSTIVGSLLYVAQAVLDRNDIQHLLLEEPPTQAQNTTDKTIKQKDKNWITMYLKANKIFIPAGMILLSFHQISRLQNYPRLLSLNVYFLPQFQRPLPHLSVLDFPTICARLENCVIATLEKSQTIASRKYLFTNKWKQETNTYNLEVQFLQITQTCKQEY